MKEMLVSVFIKLVPRKNAANMRKGSEVQIWTNSILDDPNNYSHDNLFP